MKNKPAKIFFYLIPSFAELLWIVTFFVVIVFGRQLMNLDGDLPMHLSMGRYILNHGYVPLEDVFSHTLAGQPAAQHKWLAQLLFALVERSLGLGGVVLLCAVVIASAFWLVYKHAQQNSSTLSPVVVVSLLAVSTSTVHWLIRPHVITFLFLAAWMFILDQLRKGKLNLWWVLPVMMLLWVNLHGGFIAGFVTWLIYGIGVGFDAWWQKNDSETPLPNYFWRYYILGGITALGASLLNPSGIELWKLIFFHLGNQYLADLFLEFLSPNFHTVILYPFLIYIGLLVIVLGLSKKRSESGLLFNTAAWLVMALYTVRNVPLFAIVAAPLLVQGLDEFLIIAASRISFLDRLKQIDQRLKAVDVQLKGFVWPLMSVVFVLVGLSLGFRFDFQGQGYGFDPAFFPVAAVDWLETNPQEGEMFNEFLWGGYLQYRLWPDKLVFIDSNSDFYGEDFVRQYRQVILLEEGWQDVLERYDVAWAILPPDEDSARAMQSELGWKVIYEDGTAIILSNQ